MLMQYYTRPAHTHTPCIVNSLSLLFENVSLVLLPWPVTNLFSLSQACGFSLSSFLKTFLTTRCISLTLVSSFKLSLSPSSFYISSLCCYLYQSILLHKSVLLSSSHSPPPFPLFARSSCHPAGQKCPLARWQAGVAAGTSQQGQQVTQICGKAELEVREPPRGSTHVENGKSWKKGGKRNRAQHT